MFYLIHSTKDSDKKNQKSDGPADFWAWPKNGPIWLSSMKMDEIQKKIFLQLMAFMYLVDNLLQNFCPTNYIAAQTCYVKRPKKDYFSSKT